MARPGGDEIRATLLRLAHERGRGRSFCPSEAARALSAAGRPLMGEVRRVAAGMSELRATQKGAEVDAASARGPIRLSLR